MQDTRPEAGTEELLTQAQVPLTAAQPQRRWEVLWAATMVTYNALLDSPLSAFFGAVASGLGEIITTGAMCFALFILASSRTHRKRYIDLVWPLVAFSVYVVIQSLVVSVHPVVVLYGLKTIARLPLVILFVALAANTDRDRRWLLQVVLGVGMVESAALIAQYLAPDLSFWKLLHPTEEVDSVLGRMAFPDNSYASGTFSRYSYAAEFLISVAMLAVGGITVAGKRTIGVVVTCVVVAVAVFVTMSRTGQLALVLGGAVVFARRKHIIPTAVVFGAFLSVAVVLGRGVDYGATTSNEASNVVERFLSLFSEEYWEVQTSDEELQRLPAAIDGTQKCLRDTHCSVRGLERLEADSQTLELQKLIALPTRATTGYLGSRGRLNWGRYRTLAGCPC